jgi:hypothetical protein
VDDAVALRADGEYCDSILGAVTLQRCYLLCRLRLSDREVLVYCGDIMVGACRNLLRTENLDTTLAQARKSLRTCHLVDILTVDIEYARAAVNDADRVRIPNLIEKCIHRLCYF